MPYFNINTKNVLTCNQNLVEKKCSVMILRLFYSSGVKSGRARKGKGFNQISMSNNAPK